MIHSDVKVGAGTKIFHPELVVLYGCSLGRNCKVGPFVEIQKGVVIGNNCKISSHAFICEGVTIEDNVFIGHGVTFTNDCYPRATNEDGSLQADRDWQVIPTLVRKGASIGTGATILPGIEIGEKAIVGAGSVVTKNVPAHTIMAGNPARRLRRVSCRKDVKARRSGAKSAKNPVRKPGRN